MSGHTAIVIPVREAETVVRQRALAAGSPVQPQDGGVMAHVALVDPFLAEAELDDGVIADLERYFGAEGTFGFELTGVATLDDGTAYLVPEPAAAFGELALGLVRIFPRLAAGASGAAGSGELIPRVTVPLVGDEGVGALRDDVAHRLPIEVQAWSATLLRVADHDTRTLATFPFGSTAA